MKRAFRPKSHQVRFSLWVPDAPCPLVIDEQWQHTTIISASHIIALGYPDFRFRAAWVIIFALEDIAKTRKNKEALGL